MKLASISHVLGAACLLGAASAQDQPLPKKLPAGLEATIFAAPPMVNYPTFVAASPSGELYVSVDKNGSLDTKPDRGFIYKVWDTDGDGKADKKTVFADKVTSARGLDVDGDTVYCLHPPELEAFRDKDGDGIAEERTVLIKGIGFDLSKRPPDHTSNGVTLGIDGWLYIAMGDFGFMEAEGKDGRKLRFRYGGVIRVRTDGTEMEVFTRGTRNIYGVAVDPWLNAFARDNTNDGGGWDTRVEAYFYGANLGYPRLFKNFTDETMPVLGIYGGGSGVSGVYVQEKGFGWPAGYDDCLYTCDWGRSEIYRHPMKDKGATFEIGQDVFCQLERVTDMKVDALGRAYLASWRGAQFSYAGENVGYIVQVAPPARRNARLTQNLKKMTAKELSAAMKSQSHQWRLASQRELLRRSDRETVKADLAAIIADAGQGVPNRIAALFTAKQIFGAQMNEFLIKLTADAKVKEFALRALADRPAEAKDAPANVFADALKDPNDHVKAQAAIGLSRLGKQESADALLTVAAQAKESVTESAPASAPARPKAETGVIKRQTKDRSLPIEADITGAKTLYLVVSDSGDGDGADHAVWMEPRLTGASGEKKLTELKWKSATQGWGGTNVNKDCTGKQMVVDGKPVPYGIGTHANGVIAYDLPAGYSRFIARGGLDDQGGSIKFQVYVDTPPPVSGPGKSSSASEALYTDASRALPHLASQALINLGAADACLKALDSEPSRHPAALRVLRNLHDSKVVEGLVARLGKAQNIDLQRGIVTALVRLYNQEGPWTGDSWGTRPDTAGPYYKRDPWAETPRIEKALTEFASTATPPLKAHLSNELTRHRVQLKGLSDAPAATADPLWARDQQDFAKAMTGIANMKQGDIGTLEPHVVSEQALAVLNSGKADAKNGAALFISQGCISCHVAGKDDPAKGPNLFDIAARYKPDEIITSILNPSATVSQGFPTHIITAKDGQMFSGFVIKESGDEVVLRNMAALTQVIPVSSIAKREKHENISSMTPGLVNNLTPAKLADLLEYFRSLIKK